MCNLISESVDNVEREREREKANLRTIADKWWVMYVCILWNHQTIIIGNISDNVIHFNSVEIRHAPESTVNQDDTRNYAFIFLVFTYAVSILVFDD